MSHTRLLIVHPDPNVGALMTSMLHTLGHKIDEAPNDRAAVRMLEHAPVDLVLAGADPDDSDALEFLTYLRRKYPRIPVILLFPSPHPERAREAQLRGALAVLRFPLPANALRAAVAQVIGEPEVASTKNGSAVSGGVALSGLMGTANGGVGGHGPYEGNGTHAAPPAGQGITRSRLMFEASMGLPSTTASRDEEAAGLMGEDPAFRHAVELAGTIAATRAPVLIVGERGVGKSLLARTLHTQGPRPDGPYLEVACGSLKEAVLDIELFGAQGGYGAPNCPGKVAQARGGTLFIDEISLLSPALQHKLLRLVRDAEYEPVGGHVERADMRIVLGTREDLATMAADGRFRQDLYYRIGVVTLKLPPLRHRGADLERLAEHFRVKCTRHLGKDVRGFSPEARDLLRSYNWPGNVQELEQAVERAVIVCRGSRIEPNHLALITRDIASSRAPSRSHRTPDDPGILPLKEALEAPEKELILQALEALNWNRQETARVLDINRTTLYKKMKKYGLLFDEPAWVN